MLAIADGSYARNLGFQVAMSSRRSTASASRKRRSRTVCGDADTVAGASLLCAAASRSLRCSADEPARQGSGPSLFAAAGLDKDAPRPLADKLRPETLDDVVGQDHLLGPDGALTRMLATRSLGSLVFWGPPGTGKTTVARLLAQATDLHFEQISAIFTGVADLKKVFEAGARSAAKRGRARCCSSTRSTASTARSRTASCL